MVELAGCCSSNPPARLPENLPDPGAGITPSGGTLKRDPRSPRPCATLPPGQVQPAPTNGQRPPGPGQGRRPRLVLIPA